MATLKDIVSDVYGRMGLLHSGTATGGSTTTVVDSALGGKQDDWKNAVVMVDYDAGGAGAAPEGEYKLCSAYAALTGTLTTAAFSSGVAAGDLYSVASPSVPLAKLVSLINRRLASFGDIPAVDTSLSFSTGASVYTLPAAARGGRLKQVWAAGSSDSDDPALYQREDWTPYGTSQIIFTGPIDSGQTLHLFYIGAHSRLGAYGDTLSPFVHIDRVASDVAYWATRLYIAQGRGASKEMEKQLQMLFNDAETSEKKHKIWLPMAGRLALMVPDGDQGRSNRYGPWLTV